MDVLAYAVSRRSHEKLTINGVGELVFWIRATRITMLKLADPPCKECVLSIRFTSTLAHRITPHLDPMRIVDQPVEDAVSQCGIADLLVPA
jgi:hypothetical protein